MRRAILFTTLTVAGAMVAVPALAQNAPEPGAPTAPPAAPAPDRRAERRQREVERAIQQLVERLGLDETQAARVNDVVRASVDQIERVRAEAEQRTQALEQAREAKIAELLTPEQAGQYKQLQAERDERRQRAQRGRAERGRGADGEMGPGGDAGRGLLGRMLGADAGRMAEELGLSEEQRGQIQAAFREVLAGARETFARARAEGPEGARQAAEALRAQVQERLGQFLTDEQRAKLATLLSDRGARGRGADAGREGRPGRQPANPAERADRRLDGVLRDLGLSEDERLVLETRIREILTLDADAGASAAKEREALEALVRTEGEVDATALRARMDALRAARESSTQRREAAEAELRELVTIKQEAVLVLHRVLR